jgi:IS5 family transposase
MDLFTQIPALCLQFEPVLAHLDRLLEDDELFQRVKADLARRRPQTLTRGRSSTPVEVILRMLVVRRLYDWSYEETEHFVGDSLTLRQFCRLYLEKVPDDTVLIRWVQQLGPETLEQLNARVVELARQQKVTRGRKLRVDTTVVETNVHYPTDASLLADGIRVLGRLLGRAKALLPDRAALGRDAFRDRTRSAVRWVRTIARQARQQARRSTAGTAATASAPPPEGPTALQAAYAALLALARRSRAQAQQVGTALRQQSGAAAQRLAAQFAPLLAQLEQVILQTEARVLIGEPVPALEKVVSLFEPHTQIIKRGKAGQAVELGRKLLLSEVEGGIISHYRVLEGAGPDAPYLRECLTAHQERFGRAPDLLAGDRGFATPDNEQLARAAGVKRVVLPRAGPAPPARKEQERQRWFRRGYRWRAGIEGRISGLKRRYGLARCREHGEAGLGRWVGWGIVVANLVQIAQTQAAHPTS